ncbi:PXDN-like protein [Mya arenaria]|uniref:PXDN-like protein n=1 Tax=Mya arenaria TaxID=6604 RepID=A0ABY7FWF4_MYAAR|nr:PXDN-like protein [Mya arenaria]
MRATSTASLLVQSLTRMGAQWNLMEVITLPVGRNVESWKSVTSPSMIGGEVVDTNKDELFDDDTLHTFWVRFENDKLQVARNAISISAGKADSLTAKFPVFDRIILETEPGRPQSLAGLPFLFESHVVRFGIRTPGAASNLDNKHVIDLENTNTNEKLTVTFRANRTGNEINVDEIVINFRRDLTSPVEEVTVQSVKVPHVDFVDGSGKTHNEFSAFWISAISNRLYAGAGNEVGKNAMIDLYSIPQGTTAFRPNDVIVRSMDVQWGTPRKTSLAGRSLPTARDVSLAVHTNIGASTTWSDTLTMAVMQMGQFVDHDLIATPVETGSGHINCHCVNGSYIETEEIESRFCFNINITEKTDPSGSQGEFSSEKFDCFAFVRNREQLNELTAYVDGSNIYGSEQTAAKELRKHDEHLRGDFRVNEQPSLASMHTLWVREHNRVAQELVDNCGYEDDTEAASNELYHAARRIVIAEYQTSVTENLFRMGTKIALDLAALNIQRGRDHGVSYCATRKALGLKVPATFQEAENMELFSTETIALLKDCYDRICDIDLFTAIVAELPLQNRTDQTSDSPIPETLNHIQGDMFQKLKLGDRFWFEFPRAGFNEAQKEALRKITLSTIICENVLKSGSDEIQPNAFHVAGEGNEKVSCNAIPKLDITLFQRDSFELRDEGTEGAAQRDYNIPPANDGTSGEADRILPNEPEGNTVDDAAEEREIEDEIDHLIDMFARLDEKEPHEEN